MTSCTAVDHGRGRAIWLNIYALLTEFLMSWIKITERVQSSVPAFIYDLLHGGKATIGGRELRIESLVLPVGRREADHILWEFPEPVRVSTPGPDSRLSAIKQYRDKITFNVVPWASVEILFNES